VESYNETELQQSAYTKPGRLLSNSSGSVDEIPPPPRSFDSSRPWRGNSTVNVDTQAAGSRLSSKPNHDAGSSEEGKEAHIEAPSQNTVLVANPGPVGSRPTPSVYEIPESSEHEPTVTQAPKLPKALVHSENPLDSAHTMAHTMQPGDSILTVGVDPFASGLVLGMGGAGPRPLPNRVTAAVHGATFAAGGTTYTASIDRDLNIVVGSSILKPGGAAATLAGGEAVVSVVPGGALVVDGGTLTMSALHPPVTGAVVNVAGRIMTATQTSGSAGKLLIIGTNTITAGRPAKTIFGQAASFGPDGLAVGGLIAAISTMTYSEVTTPSALLTATRVSGFARYSSVKGANATSTVLHGTGNSINLSWPILLFEGLFTLLAMFIGCG
jgi:hypothetical protein